MSTDSSTISSHKSQNRGDRGISKASIDFITRSPAGASRASLPRLARGSEQIVGDQEEAAKPSGGLERAFISAGDAGSVISKEGTGSTRGLGGAKGALGIKASETRLTISDSAAGLGEGAVNRTAQESSNGDNSHHHHQDQPRQSGKSGSEAMISIPGFGSTTFYDRRTGGSQASIAASATPRTTSATPTSNGTPVDFSSPASSKTAQHAHSTATLSSLPHNILSLIAYHIVASSPSSHPGFLSAALESCRAFHQAASFESNPQLYHDLFLHTFDFAAMLRRYKWMKNRLVQARMANIALEHARNAAADAAKHSAASREKDANTKDLERPGSGGGKGKGGSGDLVLNKANGTQGQEAGEGRTEKPEKEADKPIISPAAVQAKQTFDLFGDPRSWAMDYKERWITAKRMRLNVRAQSMVVEGKCNRNDMMADLWNIWFLLTENDGKNLHFLASQCDFVSWMSVYNDDIIQTDAATPGYPEETGAKALGVWIALISGTDLVSEQSANQVDEKIFTLRPYVFACAKYEILYARWTMRQLPTSLLQLGGQGQDKASTTGGTAQGAAPGTPGSATPTTSAASAATPTLSAGQSKAVPYRRFGYTWRRAPPNLILGTYLYFLRLLDRQPGRRLSADAPGPDAHQVCVPAPSPTSPSAGLFNSSRLLPSTFHDREWQRNSVCQDPATSPGLPALTFKGELAGYWRGKFLFYDFDMYRRVLAGDVRAVYTGRFAEQHLELELRETIVRVPVDKVGGDGPAVCAGFKEEAEGELPAEQQRIRDGYGWEIVHEDESDLEKEQGGNGNGEDEPGWTKEILLSGVGRTSWGMASIRGRVRAWDGMIILQMAYSPMERWVWRGYLHTGGYLLGMWRDSFSPEHQRGYEGPFGIVRAGDVSYPPYFPTSMNTVPSPQAGPAAQPAHAATGAAAPPPVAGAVSSAAPSGQQQAGAHTGQAATRASATTTTNRHSAATDQASPTAALPAANDASPSSTPSGSRPSFGAMPVPANSTQPVSPLATDTDADVAPSTAADGETSVHTNAGSSVVRTSTSDGDVDRRTSASSAPSAVPLSPVAELDDGRSGSGAEDGRRVGADGM